MLNTLHIWCYNLLFSRSLANIFEIFTVLVSSLHIILPRFSNSSTLNTSGAHLGAIVIFTAWFNFTLLLGKLPSTGIYIQVSPIITTIPFIICCNKYWVTYDKTFMNIDRWLLGSAGMFLSSSAFTFLLSSPLHCAFILLVVTR